MSQSDAAPDFQFTTQAILSAQTAAHKHGFTVTSMIMNEILQAAWYEQFQGNDIIRSLRDQETALHQDIALLLVQRQEAQERVRGVRAELQELKDIQKVRRCVRLLLLSLKESHFERRKRVEAYEYLHHWLERTE